MPDPCRPFSRSSESEVLGGSLESRAPESRRDRLAELLSLRWVPVTTWTFPLGASFSFYRRHMPEPDLPKSLLTASI